MRAVCSPPRPATTSPAPAPRHPARVSATLNLQRAVAATLAPLNRPLAATTLHTDSLCKNQLSEPAPPTAAKPLYQARVTDDKLSHVTKDGACTAFLTAANVARERLRRVQVEWHDGNHASLLRMMRRDNSPAARAVLRIVGIEYTAGEHDDQGHSATPARMPRVGGGGAGRRLVLLLSDGWYIARAVLETHLEEVILSSQLVAKDRVRMLGASLQSFLGPKVFVFVDGDELGDSVLKLHFNGIVRVKRDATGVTLGAQKGVPWTRPLHHLVASGSPCVALSVVVFKRYAA